MVGDWFYMPPEAEDGHADLVTPRGDVYSLGKVLYWLLAGKVFNRDGLLAQSPGDRLFAGAGEVAAEVRTYARVLTGLTTS